MRRLSIGLVALMALSACHGHASRGGTAAGSSSATCVNGWTVPPASSSDLSLAMRVIRTTLGIRPLTVDDIRFFSGPESPPADDKAYLKTVDRWYVKAGDDTLGGRFLVERRQFGIGLVAAAPFDTSGYDSSDWIGFQYDSATPPRAVEGIPGTIRAVTYDFVDGGEGLEFPGLPDQVAGCMDGT